MTTPRAMTLIELMIALAITVVITAGIAGMVSAVSAGSMASRDAREVMVRAAVAQARLDSYVVPARSVLARTPTQLVLWLNDDHQSDTVHLTEVRWLNWDSATRQVRVQLAALPDSLTRRQSLLADTEYADPAAADWESIRQSLQASNRLRTIALVDGVAAIEMSIDSGTPSSARRVTLAISFATSAEPVTMPISASVLLHRPPP